MTGIVLLLVVGFWIRICIFFTEVWARLINPSALRWVAVPVIFFLQLCLPVADEIVGGFQFRELCRANAVFRMGVSDPAGRVTKVTFTPPQEEVPDTAISILHTGTTYTDINTNEVVVAFDAYVAKGGMLIKTLGISESNSPLTMGEPYCSPEREKNDAAPHSMKFSVVN